MNKFCLLAAMIIIMVDLCGGQGVWLSRATSYSEVISQFSAREVRLDINNTAETATLPTYPPLMGQTFRMEPFPLGHNAKVSSLSPVTLGTMMGSISPTFGQDFGGNWEKNLQYAGKSSFRVIGRGNWTSVHTPWLIR